MQFLYCLQLPRLQFRQKNDDPKTPTSSDAAENNAFAEAQYNDNYPRDNHPYQVP